MKIITVLHMNNNNTIYAVLQSDSNVRESERMLRPTRKIKRSLSLSTCAEMSKGEGM